jgi:hypothetical protein
MDTKEPEAEIARVRKWAEDKKIGLRKLSALEVIALAVFAARNAGVTKDDVASMLSASVERCARCREWFVSKRRGARFCSPECSQLQRSLDYYHSHKKLKAA